MTQKPVGTGQDSTATERPVGTPILPQSSELLIETYHAELSLNFDTTGGPQSYRLSIEAPTFQAVSGICRELSARFLDIVSRDQSSGGSSGK